MDLQNLDVTTILIIMGIVVFVLFLIGSVSGREKKSATSEKNTEANRTSEGNEDDLEIQRESESKPCPQCGTNMEPQWGDYYQCSECGFAFTGTGRWTNGHMPKLLLQPLQIYAPLVVAVITLFITIFVIF